MPEFEKTKDCCEVSCVLDLALSGNAKRFLIEVRGLESPQAMTLVSDRERRARFSPSHVDIGNHGCKVEFIQSFVGFIPCQIYL